MAELVQRAADDPDTPAVPSLSTLHRAIRRDLTRGDRAGLKSGEAARRGGEGTHRHRSQRQERSARCGACTPQCCDLEGRQDGKCLGWVCAQGLFGDTQGNLCFVDLAEAAARCRHRLSCRRSRGVRSALANLATRTLSELETLLRKRLKSLQYWHRILNGILAGADLTLDRPN
ncbi:hypothetical protein ACWC9U_35210 [Streptomyces sp. 900116325]